ncbi:MAG: hypothetical protein IM613_12060 [Cytophagales bacterium]|jgi:hypothetical protein|nr:hypothetical protein [Cytophagales bacterium]
MTKLEEYILCRIKENPDFSFSVTLSCGCCGETRHFYLDLEDLQDRSDDELLSIFEQQCELFLNRVESWYESGSDSFRLSLC